MSRTAFILLFMQIPLLCKGTEYDQITTLDMTPGRLEYILSPNFPYSVLDYSEGKRYAVAWIINAPSAYIIKIKALTFNMTRSTFCNADSLAIAEDGDPDMYGARKFCGNVTTLISESKENKMKLEFIATGVPYTNPEGKFVLQVSAVPSPSFCTCGVVESYDTFKRYANVEMDGARESPIKSVVAIFDLGLQRVFCSGTIISRKHVLTLAHCLDERSTSDVAVIPAKYDLNENGGSDMYKASRFIIHHKYERGTCQHDIGLLVIEWEFQFGDLRSVCLPYKLANVDLTGRNVSAIGYNIAFAELGTMQELDVTITNYYPDHIEGFMDTRAYRETCSAESGGPILYREEYKNIYQVYTAQDGQMSNIEDTRFEYIVGIVSYRYFGKGNVTGRDIKVVPYLDWIWANSDRIPHCRY